MTDAWAADVAAGHDTALLAWRRQDVADLNRLARDQWDPPRPPPRRRRRGRPAAAGTPSATASSRSPPTPSAGIVTSEPLTVLAVDRATPSTVRTTDGRAVRLTGDALDAEHLDYGYALTVHRAQGATYDRAHVLAAGGGRELAYVALSRARDHTTIHATADDLAQAVDDLQADWGVDRHQRWITDTPARPGQEPEPSHVASRLGNVAALPTPPLADQQGDAQRRLIDLHDDYDVLLAGKGRWADTPAGAAARALNAARQQLTETRRAATAARLHRRRDRRVRSQRDTDGS